MVSVTDHGFLYGDGVFEGMRAYNGRLFRLDDHMRRLQASAKALALEIPGGLDHVRKVVLEGEDQKLYSVIKSFRTDGMQTFNDSLFDFLQKEYIARPAAYEISPNVEELKMKLKGIEVRSTSM